MNMKQWKESVNNQSWDDRNEFWYWRNKAVEYFNLKKGEVIHHLMDTDEQKRFNREHYERWGFDFDGTMKYCVKMTKEEHDAYHVSLRKGKRNTPEHNKHVSESLKKLYATPEGKEIQKRCRENQWARDGAHEQQSNKLKEYFSDPENRKKLSESMKGLILWTDGNHKFWAKECPEGCWKAESPNKGKHLHGKRCRKIRCIETQEVFWLYEVTDKYPKASHCRDVADGIRKISGGLHWEWV